MIINSLFVPAKGLGNAHLQTLWSALFRSKNNQSYITETIELNDGDFLDLAWSSQAIDGKPIVIIFHGLEGSIQSPYVSGLLDAVEKAGWTGLLMHFRGCSGRLNRLPRSYHSGETQDAMFLINKLASVYPNSKLAAVGYSLGGNMLLKLQAELAELSPLKAAVSICAPLMLDVCAAKLEKGFSKIYQFHLLRDLRKKLLLKSKNHNYKELIGLDSKQIKTLKSFWVFDDLVTAPLHGFTGVDDYYQQSSCRQYLHKINTPTLIIQALDDPFMSEHVIPAEAELSQSITLELSRKGGHVGFIGGHILKPQYWLENRVVDYLKNYLDEKIK